MDVAQLHTPIGILQIKGDAQGVSSISFVETEMETSSTVSENTQLAIHELKDYFSKKTKKFTFVLNPHGTEFQRRVWEQLQLIEFGKTKSYQEMANRLGNPKVIRAAASANGKNPIAIVIPCHRVIGSDGSLTGYASGLHRKKWLLAHESPVKQVTLF